ncbi:Methyltransferase domain-containing protein [Sinosporangium album]|uniref:Methyltransferase domain-containing protein n=1 Tax=Sinosporangium album TaxID=504805 RepID=A0A1G7THL7_9ACTN|nr:class I SAM-dependent methyltransferase [Sinosporangium album]SDG34514.1 Methyltransferase domain-containing protein [Sinosporangium album]
MSADALHRRLFGLLSLFSPRMHTKVLRRYFNWWHRSPDPWKLQVSLYELNKYRTTLDHVPREPYTRILDAGCSEGTFTHLLAREHPGAEIVGVDISERALARARARGEGPRFIAADLTDPGTIGVFDLVFCAETLYYLGRDERLRHVSRRLRDLVAPGGVLVLVHPWPEARRLHRHLEGDPVTRRIAEHVENDPHRPFSVTCYRRL